MIDIKQLLSSLGIARTYIGFSQAAYAIHLATHHEDVLDRITKDLYPAVADHFGVSAGSVERNIRTVIQTFWKRGNRTLYNKISGCEVEDKPRNGEFISTLATYCSRHYSDK